MLIALLACASPEPAAPPTPPPAPAPVAVTVDPARLAAFAPLPAVMTPDGAAPSEALVTLGRTLYYETRLSKNHDLSCNSCHLLDRYGVDPGPTSTGHKGQKGGRNAPTTYNAGGHLAQFWDGRAADLEAQAKGPILNPIEMAIPDEATAVAVLRSIPGYAPLFAAAFPGQADPVTYDNMALAIGAFERGLVTPAPLDAFLAGDATALTDAQKRGLATFVDTGCTTCHSGAYVGGGMYQKAGLVKPWPDLADKGRGAVTGNPAEDGFFKVPSLRNIEKTGPYFHDGSVPDLDAAIRRMATHQLGKELTDAQVGEIRAFLGALTGPLPTAYIAPPTPLPDGPRTPKPDPS